MSADYRKLKGRMKAAIKAHPLDFEPYNDWFELCRFVNKVVRVPVCGIMVHENHKQKTEIFPEKPAQFCRKITNRQTKTGMVR
jgi:hypothetical protein